MPYTEGKTVSGWGVFRSEPWHFDSIYVSEHDAKNRAVELGGDYTVEYGENRSGTDDFVWSKSNI